MVMKSALGLAVVLAAALCAVGGTAQAKPAPVEAPGTTLWSEIAAAYSPPAAALREHDYFQAPQSPTVAGRGPTCRPQVTEFNKVQIARGCD